MTNKERILGAFIFCAISLSLSSNSFENSTCPILFWWNKDKISLDNPILVFSKSCPFCGCKHVGRCELREVHRLDFAHDVDELGRAFDMGEIHKRAEKG